MAESILRLKVSSEEYDSKLKRAAEGIQRLASKIHDSQGEFVGLTNDQKEFIRNLQYMNTVSQTATGKVKELETAYKGLQTMYNGFNAFEKNSEEGKILAEQLSILKEKTLQARKEMEDANKSLSSTGGFLDQLTSKFTVNIDALKLFDIGMKAAGAALDVAKDAFFASESTVDEWGRTMDASKSLYEGFLTALNTGDISGYLSRIDSIVQAARAAYNELDRLGTMKTIQAPQMSAQQTENERMRMMIQTGHYIAPVDGRGNAVWNGKQMQNGQLLAPEQIRILERQLQGGMQKVVTLVGNEVAQTGRAIDAVYNRQAQELGMSLKEFRKGTSSMAEFDKRMAGYDQYQKWRAEHTTIDMQSGRETVARGNPYAEFAKWGTFRVDGQRYNDLIKLIQQRDQQAGSLYGMQSQAYRTMNRAEGVTLRQLMGGGSGGGGARSGGGSGFNADSIAFNVPDVEKIDENRNFISGFATLTDEAKKQMLGLADATEDLGGALAKIGEAQVVKEMNDRIQAQVAEVQKTKKAWTEAAQAVGLVGNMMGSIKDPAAQTASAVAQAIANIALAYSQALGEDGTIKSNIWYFIAASAAAMVSMATTISQIHSATGYAQGGIVKGNSYSGDNMMFGGDGLYGLNAGELVLTRAQQNSLANQLEGNGIGNLNLHGVLQGENILISIDRTLQRQGRELAVWGRGGNG